MKSENESENESESESESEIEKENNPNIYYRRKRIETKKERELSTTILDYFTPTIKKKDSF
ncbi:hypothetical protein BCR32DRAFT_277820 [Anaeromyces robustus]|uniref:Uncharacterized protein n=1 Tax=Anaeromyces robustus TaxID=1754192 RepID=A0A1Y1XD60_9FUNG|nr:hypothetical protein BCR32DRAFT_277820 [Anaeromyces robustus]|eukprot:ORX83657.1 hypothetical protein BCR32DRAFT_277820 [Anaeromyces robustus]